MSERKTIPDEDLLSSGSTLVNLACTGNRCGAFPKGFYILFVGDSDSGKTWFCLNALAEAAIKESFKEYNLIYDSVEYGAIMNMEQYFGKALTERLMPAAANSCPSSTIEGFYFNLEEALSVGPCVYVLDSMDALTSEPEQKKVEEHREAYEKEQDPKGDYGDGKAKINSRRLRPIIGKLQETKSILIIINQTRDNIGKRFFSEPSKVYSGGHALTFYSTIRLWSKTAGKLRKTVRKKERQIGIKSRVDVKRSRVTGKERSVEVPIYHSYGIDDIGSCVDYLVDESTWKKNSGSIVAEGLGPKLELRRDKLIEHIEGHELEEDLRELVSNTWQEIEELSALKRKRRY